jgi:dipeptidyl aminopeptidase/acylaminoacyl peptidase
MSVNYRGSSTFGHEFESAIRGELGRREVDDIVAARTWLVDHGVADPDLVFLTGWSYGGYLTLHASGMAPGLWAGGMAGIAIADWRLMFEDMAETLRQYAVALFGGGPDDVPDVYRSSSPITYAEHVDTPLLVFQGSNDTRCPARQLRVYEERLRELGKPIEVEWFDAGHGTLDAEQQIRFQQQMLDFAGAIVDERTATRA